MFDYKKFENNVVQQMEIQLNKWLRENDDIYIFSLDCARGMESIGAIANTNHFLIEQAEPNSQEYWYYKYCEEEWELWAAFETISSEMNTCLIDNEGIYSDTENFEYSESFDKHCENIMECCVNSLIRFRQSLNQKHMDIILTFSIREYLDDENKMKIFEKINGKDASEEYFKHSKEIS